jgi:hypothetical protein
MSLSTIAKFAFTGLLLTVAAFAQETRGTIAGTVTDTTGAAVPNVQVEARNVDTSATATAKTN